MHALNTDCLYNEIFENEVLVYLRIEKKVFDKYIDHYAGYAFLLRRYIVDQACEGKSSNQVAIAIKKSGLAIDNLNLSKPLFFKNKEAKKNAK